MSECCRRFAQLSLHINAPVPQMRDPYDILQPVLDRRIAKDREQRYPSAGASLKDLEEMGF